ncbi:type I 3-dehydroquinate dehydratase [Methanospirillum lacunae]|uniref:3-dehydroquinate dehydratase n=1 Tax=Methanospirillum lacunae TaxID=668570 RepID=A0A2V2N7S5_9EURY|nr:type I 3-dehydroquinate dehydratase [Methanospirillum lacunae]PWR73756.1 3-dehydroquinate dehydratase [Methanospirillum lacunae]
MADENTTIIQTVVSLSSPRQFESEQIKEADAVEIRLDLITEPIEKQLDLLTNSFKKPIILTLRSSAEGGAFAGDPDGWIERITPFLSFVTMVDVEIRFKEHAPRLKEMGITTIASCHRNEMLSPENLMTLYKELRSFGDIPKIAVQPQDTADLLTLLQFTNTAPKPLIVSVTGMVCRYARPLLPLFGSLYTYCYIDSPTSPGQYSLREMRMLAHLLSPGVIDTWFQGRPVRSGDPSLFYRLAGEIREHRS